MSVAFVLTCLIGLNQAQMSPAEMRCGQAFATEAACRLFEKSIHDSVASTFMLPKCVKAPVQKSEEWCAPKTIMRIKPGNLTISENGQTAVLSYREPFGTGLNGDLYMDPASLKRHLLLHARIKMDSGKAHAWEPEIRIFRNRVFWPCKLRNEDKPALSGIPSPNDDAANNESAGPEPRKQIYDRVPAEANDPNSLTTNHAAKSSFDSGTIESAAKGSSGNESGSIKPGEFESRKQVYERLFPEGSYLVQLGTFSTRSEAYAVFDQLMRKRPDLIRDLQPMVNRADLGASGIFFRISAGPVLDRLRAETLCRELVRAGHKHCLTKAFH